jgi:AcrR family transcriptional regulator
MSAVEPILASEAQTGANESQAGANESQAGPVTDKGRRTREKILSAARGVFEERGFTDTRMSDVASAAGVSHGTVYVYFESKESLLSEIIDAVLGEAATYLRVADISDPQARVAQANQRYLRVYDRNARLLQVVEQVATADANFAEKLNEFRARHVRRLADAIAGLQQSGRVASDIDAGVAAAALSAMVEGYARHATDIRVEDANDTLTRLWVRALGLAGEEKQ